MDSSAAYRLFIAMFFVAVIRQTVLGYWNWRNRRLALPYEIRNAGFLTDGKLRFFERTSALLFILNALAVLAFVVWFVGATREWWPPYWPL